jgi:hypothetical protein
MGTIKQLQNDPYKLYAAKVAKVESGNNPNAKNPYSSAGGLFQFTSGSFEGVSNKYNLGYTAEDRFDPVKSQKAFELFTKDNARAIEGTLGHTPTDADLYMAHFLGAGGANTFFKGYGQNPNAPITSVVSPAVVNANKSVMLDKNGNPRTLQQVYDWANKKMNITPGDIPVREGNITQEFTNYETPGVFSNFGGNAANLYSVPKIEEKETQPAAEAQKKLEQKTSEEDFLNDLSAARKQYEQQSQPLQQIPIEQQNILQQYQEVSSFVEQPIQMQNGGQIPVSSRGMYDYPNQPVTVPTQNGHLTMKNINHPILAVSSTGEKQIMMPGLEYFFSPQPQNILEIPLKNYE